MSYNGHKNYNAWNVSLWINNDEGLYNRARNLCRFRSKDKAAKMLLEELPEKTPDGVKYTLSTVRLAIAEI